MLAMLFVQGVTSACMSDITSTCKFNDVVVSVPTLLAQELAVLKMLRVTRRANPRQGGFSQGMSWSRVNSLTVPDG